MFDGVPSDQFHQFIAAAAAAAAAASSTTSQLQSPPPLSFPLHVSSSTFPSFDLYSSNSGGGEQPLQVPHLVHPLHHHSSSSSGAPVTNKDDDQDKEGNSLVSINLEGQRERSMLDLIDPWSNDEVLALLRIRSTMENWFPDFTWEHVSRKLAEQGFKRSAEKCKEKFEQESRYFNTSMNYSKNYRFFSELEELYHGESPHHQQQQQDDVAQKNPKLVNKPNEEDKSLEEGTSRNETVILVGNPCLETKKVEDDKCKGKKRKRHTHHKSFEIFKGFCEAVVNKMMAQQEEMHNKLLEDMVKRDEEKMAREETWKKQEMEKINKEIEIRAHEQSIAGDRQATIIGFLKKFTSTNPTVETPFFGNNEGEKLSKLPNTSNPPSSPSSILPQNKQLETPTSSRNIIVPPHQNPSSLATPTNQNAPIDEAQQPQNPNPILLEPKTPNSLNTQKTPSAPTSFPSTNEKDQELGKRWPRDEVLALINLRCSLNVEEKDGSKGPLWERISQGMLALGYKRSAKRCKEKWENINKYFRKTKDVSKKRSLDSRTCPYFQQLSALYTQGTLVVPSSEAPAPENRSQNHSALPENRVGGGASNNPNMHAADEGEENVAQLPAYDFKF